MFKTALEIIIAIALAGITISLCRQRGKITPRHLGFDLLLIGLGLVTFASWLDALEVQEIVGSVHASLRETFLFVELVIGYLVGILLAGFGLMSWVPALVRYQGQVEARLEAESALQASTAELERRNRSLMFINRLADRLHSSLDSNSIARVTVQTLAESNAASLVLFYTADRGRAHLELLAEHGCRNGLHQAIARLPMPLSVKAAFSDENLPIELKGEDADTRVSDELNFLLATLDAESLLLVPLLADGELMGIIVLAELPAAKLSAHSRETLRAIGHSVSLALTNARHLAVLDHQAHHDSLTALASRSLLHREFEEVARGRHGIIHQAALLLIDLDRFKEINDTLGHHTGDQFLKQIGPRIQSVLGTQSALVCRLGGDEFAVLLRQVESAEAAQVTAEALLAAIKRPFVIDGIALEIGASIGISLFPTHGRDSHALLRCADIAMYQAKRASSGTAVYNAGSDPYTTERLAMMADLARAIREGQLFLEYQPKVAIATRNVVGVEALVRWRHPQYGIVEPNDFIPLAEMSDSIHSLTYWVIDAALAQQRQWRESGLTLPVAINLSPRNLLDPQYMVKLDELFRRHGACAADVEFELTETALMQDSEGSQNLLHEIAEKGVALTLDDFGTGYSSLAYLRRFPIKSLKIDRSFVADLQVNEQSLAIVNSTIHLAHNLGRGVIAEGVEDQDTLLSLQTMGCDVGQGHHISHPLEPEALPSWLKQSDWSLGGAAGPTPDSMVPH